MSNHDRLLASQVALRLDTLEPGVCPAWLESADRRCGRPATVGYLCKRHHNVAEARLAAKVKAEAELAEKRAEIRAARLPVWRERLAMIDAELADMARAPLDRAAYTGNVHPSITRSNALTSARIERSARLEREASRLRALIGDDQ